MEVGDLYIDPADDELMVYIGICSDNPMEVSHYIFYCPTAGSNADNLYYYSIYDVTYLHKIGG